MAIKKGARPSPQEIDARRGHEERVRSEVEARLGMLPREQVTPAKIQQVRRQVEAALRKK